ncbi:MAG TPA: wax ester/triacylglycerol synthase family O-acyltransferase [Jiangellales bacterium]|nr:wax ester/triacylglycerol synthase family O-acyltransferase [Jiangellales bacterium]
MPERLSPLDVSFLYLEDADTPMHVGSVAVFQVPEDGFDYDRLVSLIRDRIAFVPRYRQRVRSVPARLANPVWVDDDDFDITYHVRRSALPRPGTDAQLHELVARIMSRPLDHGRPLWEMYLVEGLEGDRFAVLSKTHHAVVDGTAAVDIAQVILDDSPEPRATPPDTWRPSRGPSSVELVVGAVTDAARRPSEVVDTVRAGLADVSHTAARALGALGGLASAVRVAASRAPHSPLNAPIGSQRRYATADTVLDDYRRIRSAHGGTVNDVVLAVVSGALRAWLLTRGESVRPSTTVRAMVPVSVRSPEEAGATGNRVSSYLVDLPVGESSPVVRLHRVSYAMKAHKEGGQAVGAEALVGIAGFSPPTLHALGARVASSLSRRVYNLVVTNVPGPQVPLYAGGARLLAAYPVVPLAQGQALSVGLTSYDGGMYFGLNADRDAMPDVEVLAQCLVDAVDELSDTVATPRARKPKRRNA